MFFVGVVRQCAADHYADTRCSDQCQRRPEEDRPLADLFVRGEQHGGELRLVPHLGDEDGNKNGSEYFQVHNKSRWLYFSPNTSCMSYIPAGFSFRKRAARSAPSAKVARLLALWVISIRSPVPANNTV